MGGPRCCAKGCINGKKVHSLFRFPKDAELRKKWLAAIGRPDWVPYEGARVCDVHFLPLQINSKTGRPFPEVVPQSSSPCCTCRDATETSHRDHPYARTASEHCRVHGQQIAWEERQTVLSIVKENCDLQAEVQGLRRAMQNKLKSNVAGGKENRPPSMSFTTQDIKKGLQLRFACGTAGFNRVRTMFEDLNLPSIRSLQVATQHIKFAPGILSEFMEPLCMKMNSFTDERDRDVTLVFDELCTKKKVEYDGSLKRMIGYGTLPGHHERLAEKGEIFVLRGVHKRMKQIAAYHLNPSSVDMMEKKKVVLELLQRAADMNVNVIAIVCDMGNRGLLSLLGYSTKKDSLKWCIQNPVKPLSKLWCVPDPVHVFKSLKECFVANKLFYLPQHIVDNYNLPSTVVDFEHVEWLEKLQRDDRLQMVPGLTFKHLRATHFSKMKVSSSHKIINPKVSAALSYLVMKGQVPPEFETTAWFLKLMNRWFQLMSSRNLQCALGLRNRTAYEEALCHLNLVINVFESSRIPGGWKPVQSHIIFSTNAVLEIQHELLHNRKYAFVQTAAFTTDTVENINSCIRITSPKPTCLQLKNRLQGRFTPDRVLS